VLAINNVAVRVCAAALIAQSFVLLVCRLSAPY
jgi:hypothetical protein